MISGAVQKRVRRAVLGRIRSICLGPTANIISQNFIPLHPRPQNPCHHDLVPPRIHRFALPARRSRCPDGLAKRARNPRGCVKGGSPPVRESGPGVPGSHTTGGSHRRTVLPSKGPGLNPASLKGPADKRPGRGIGGFFLHKRQKRRRT